MGDILLPVDLPGVDTAAARAVFPAEMEIIADHGDDGLNAFLRERDGLYDAVLISRPHNMGIFRHACPPGYMQRTNIIYDVEALLIEREALRRKVLGEPFSDAVYRAEPAKEIALTRGAHAIITVSEREAALFQRETQAKLHIIGHRLAARPTGTPFKQRKDVLFVGALNGVRESAPNVDGLLWFVEHVMPLLDKKMSDYQLLVAGRIESDDVKWLANDRVKLLGIVDDLETLYASCRIFIAPTRFAAGIPLKVMEASARGLPTIATSVVSSQLGRTHENDILVADEPAGFADCCWRLYEDAALWDGFESRALKVLGANARLSVSMQASRPCSAIFDAIPLRQNALLSRTSSLANAARGKPMARALGAAADRRPRSNPASQVRVAREPEGKPATPPVANLGCRPWRPSILPNR
jgi:O-antigen biosynthesis protein